MKHLRLNGWLVGVKNIQIEVMGEDGPEPASGWALVFTESHPPTGDTVTYEMNREVRDYVVRELTSGIVLHGGELPNL